MSMTERNVDTTPKAEATHFVDERFVAQYFQVSLATVRRWRLVGRGPRYRKLGALVRYSVQDLKVFEDSLPSNGGR